MSDPEDSKLRQRHPAEDDDVQRPIPASNLFQGRQQVLIEHEGEIYRLLLTRNNRLLLQK